VVAGTLLPHLARRDRRLISRQDEDEDVEVTRLRNTVREWRAEAARQGRPLRLPMMPFLLRNIWTGALLLFTVLTFSTFFITTVVQVCWYRSKMFIATADFVVGDGRNQFGRDMLGCGMLGTVCYHHGGEYRQRHPIL